MSDRADALRYARELFEITWRQGTAETVAAGRMPERIGSVVLAVSSADALWLADRVTTSTFVLTLRAP